MYDFSFLTTDFHGRRWDHWGSERKKQCAKVLPVASGRTEVQIMLYSWSYFTSKRVYSSARSAVTKYHSGLNNTNLLPQNSRRWEVQEQGACLIQLLVRTDFLACRYLPSCCCVFTWKRERANFSALLIRTLILLGQGSTLMTSNLNHCCLRGPISTYSHTGS